MPLVNVMVNGRAYTLGCDEGEEGHLKALAARVDVKVREAQNIVGQSAGDGKLMLMAALLMADDQHDHAPKAVEPAPGNDLTVRTPGVMVGADGGAGCHIALSHHQRCA